MGVISVKSFNEPDEVISGSRVTKRSVTVGKTYIARVEYQPGWRWSVDMKPTIKTSSCLHHHQGMVWSGHIQIGRAHV